MFAYEPVKDKKVIAYLRVSTVDQGIKSNGLNAQRNTINSIVQHRNLELVDTVTEVESAGTVYRRDKLNTIIDRMMKDRELYIIVSKVDRLVRNQLDGHTLLDKLNARIIFGDLAVTHPVSVGNHFAQAEQERVNTSIRTKEGIKEARKKHGGKWGNPQNMSNAGRRKGGKAKQDAAASNENNIRAYNFMKNLRPKCGWRDIAKRLNESKFKTSRDGEFTHGSAQQLFVRMQGNEYRDRQQLLNVA